MHPNPSSPHPHSSPLAKYICTRFSPSPLASPTADATRQRSAARRCTSLVSRQASPHPGLSHSRATPSSGRRRTLSAPLFPEDAPLSLTSHPLQCALATMHAPWNLHRVSASSAERGTFVATTDRVMLEPRNKLVRCFKKMNF
jgi:hypothetical protein